MKLNKNNAAVLSQLLNGDCKAVEITEKLPNTSQRSVQRSLVALSQGKLINRRGVNNPSYSLNYSQIIANPVPEKILLDNNRPASFFNFKLVEWLLKNDQFLCSIFDSTKKPNFSKQPMMTKRDREYLTVDLSWKSSELEGNTYSLLDTELLLVKGLKAKNKTSFETQMIINHKQALEFVFDNTELFKENISLSIVETIHKLISYNLSIKSGIRKKIVKISASNYQPLTPPHQLREQLQAILSGINRQKNPFNKSLLAFSLIPYLQAFEDGNKRVGRILANAILISTINSGFSLKNTDGRQLSLAYLAFYEFGSLGALAKILKSEIAN